jgi:hypothetical protein
MRLIEIPTVHGDLRPVGCCGLPNLGYRPLEALDPAEPFRGHSDFRPEDLDEPSVAEPGTPGHLSPCSSTPRQPGLDTSWAPWIFPGNDSQEGAKDFQSSGRFDSQGVSSPEGPYTGTPKAP